MLKALVRKIGLMAAVDFFISCLPGIISRTLSGIYLVSGIFDLILKLQNDTAKIIVDTIYGTGKQGWLNRDELIRLELEKIQAYKRKGMYNEALFYVDKVLQTEPDCPEALLLKARILWEDMGNLNSAQIPLRKLIRTSTDKNSCHYKWAYNLYNNLAVLNKKINGTGQYLTSLDKT